MKQAARKWNEKFDYFLKKYNLLVNNADACVYYNKEEVRKTIVGIHIDDGLACSIDKTKLEKIIKDLEKEFEVKTSDIEYYVGFEVKVNENRDKVFIHQSRYMQDILERFGMTECHPVSTPTNGKLLLEKEDSDDEELEEKIPYKAAVGSLMYASMISRPDISFAVNDVARWSKCPRKSHWIAIKRIFRYLKGTINWGILYHGKDREGLVIQGFNDADFANDVKDRISRTGYVFMLNHGAIAWASKK